MHLSNMCTCAVVCLAESMFSFNRFNLSNAQVEQIIKVFDADGSGTIDYAEFVKLCETDNFKDAVSSAKVAKKNKKAKKERDADDAGGGGAAVSGGGGGSKKDKGKDNEKALNDFEMNVSLSTSSLKSNFLSS